MSGTGQFDMSRWQEWGGVGVWQTQTKNQRIRESSGAVRRHSGQRRANRVNLCNSHRLSPCLPPEPHRSDKAINVWTHWVEMKPLLAAKEEPNDLGCLLRQPDFFFPFFPFLFFSSGPALDDSARSWQRSRCCPGSERRCQRAAAGHGV